MRPLTQGLVAGSVGTAALNITTYGDMLLRARPASSVPSDVVDRLAERTGVGLGEDEEASNRKEAAGALLGFVTGLGVTAAYALVSGRRRTPPVPVTAPLLGAAAMAGSDVSATALGVTDPRSWSRSAWLSDIVPHLVYGLAAGATLRALRGRAPR
ncbi:MULTISPECIES: hypothetical protein [Streptomyces]|uniref:DUF1440 domain-containing protein n=1 Tax=Streptomyces pini TaxID=1520580 RepID=A0A1I4KAG1_9ACTN|nr:MULTISPECIES: hypothetical protein [Streptomyces]SFL75718.1 hypothetical protein SAMN05192584_12641 [Streptomyces pini]